MVFQRPNPFPTSRSTTTCSPGKRLNSKRIKKADADDIVETSLRGANLWDEVKDRLDKPGSACRAASSSACASPGAIAVEPDVLLMDEPCSALDPIATLAIEELMNELKEDYTIVIVTHNMQQAARVSATGRRSSPPRSTPRAIAARACSSRWTTRPRRSSQPRRRAHRGDYITGRFG